MTKSSMYFNYLAKVKLADLFPNLDRGNHSRPMKKQLFNMYLKRSSSSGDVKDQSIHKLYKSQLF